MEDKCAIFVLEISAKQQIFEKLTFEESKIDADSSHIFQIPS